MVTVRSNDIFLFLSKKEKAQIVSAIRKAERQTSGEIRVHLERSFKNNGLEHAQEIFERLGMTRTQERNGVLILLSPREKRFFILGDEGIHKKVSQQFWDDLAGETASYFQQDRFADGLAYAIERTGAELKKYFPYQRDDKNELPDGISYSL